MEIINFANTTKIRKWKIESNLCRLYKSFVELRILYRNNWQVFNLILKLNFLLIGHFHSILGGKPRHSLYFVGYQEDKLIHLDPHFCQDMVDVNQDNFSVSSFHCRNFRKMKISKIDPSCCVGFYCREKSDFDNLQNSIQPVSTLKLSLFFEVFYTKISILVFITHQKLLWKTAPKFSKFGLGI